MNHEVRLLLLQLDHLLFEDLMHSLKVVLVGFEPQLEELERHLEESVVVSPLEYRVVHIANEVLEETSDHYIDDLANLEVNILCEGSGSVVLLKLHAACDVLFSSGKVQLVQCLVGVLSPVYRSSKVETYIIHQKPKAELTS